MTKRDFELIARLLANAHHDICGEVSREAANSIAEQFAVALTNTNDRFDRERFLRACGVR
jgi:hypothetical protein